jgi:hypothetical protein
MPRDVTAPVSPVFRTARLFFAGCVSGGVVATAFAIARDLGVPIRPERLLASLLSPPLPPASRLAAFAVFVAFAGLLAIAYGWAFRGLPGGASPGAGFALSFVHLIASGIAAGTAPLWHPHIPPMPQAGFFYAAAGPAGMLLFAAAHLAFGTLVGWLARWRRTVPR